MTRHYAEKRMARMYARDNNVTYRVALARVRDRRARVGADISRRILIEAVEGCGVTHWARIDQWDGAGCATITDLGVETYRLTVDDLSPVVRSWRQTDSIIGPLDVDSYLADEFIQTMLFGGVIYRVGIRRRSTFS